MIELSPAKSFYKLFYDLRINNLKKADINEYSSHFLIDSILNSDSVVVDLGANKGNFYSGLNNKFKCACFAVEASPALYELLPQNRTVKRFNYAIARNNGPVTFYLSDNIEASSLQTEIPEMWGMESAITIEGITIEDFLKKEKINKEIDVLKIDIEGAELDVLETITPETLASIKQIAIEFHGFLFNTEEYASRMNKSLEKLRENNFYVITFSEQEVLCLNKKLISMSLSQKLRLKVLHPTYQILRSFWRGNNKTQD